MKNRVTHSTFRGVRKTAYLSRKVFSKGAGLSGRVEKKADRIIHGTDPTLLISSKVLFEKIHAEALPEIIPIHPALPKTGRQPAVTLLIPSLQKSSFFGGTATALIIAGKLANKKKLPLRIVETLVHGKTKAKDLSLFLESHQINIAPKNILVADLAGRKYNHYGYLDIHPKDIFIASAWWDAHSLSQLPLNGKFIYLIQDFEPIFYNNSDHYIYAEATYSKDSFIPVLNTKIMRDFMAKKNYKNINSKSIFFEPAVGIGKNIGFSLIKKSNAKKRLFVYGRPSVHRNLFQTALSTVNQAFRDNILDSSEWELFMAGQDSIPNILLDGGITIENLGKLSIDQYYEFIRTIDVAISPMLAPHPNYPTLEFSSVGACVVTTKYENKNDLSHYSKNIFTCEPNQSSILEALIMASNVSLEQRIKNAEASNINSSWETALEDTIEKISSLV